MSPDGELLRLFEEKHQKFLAFVRWRSTPGLAAGRDPEDILQAAFLSAQSRWADYGRSGMSLDAWFYRIILNCLCDDHDFQSRKRRDYRADVAWPDRSSAQVGLGLKNPGTSPSEAAGRKEMQDRIEAVLGRLTPEHQEIMVLILYGDLTHVQAAALLGIEGNATRQRYARARAKFREHWKACYGLEGFADEPGD